MKWKLNDYFGGRFLTADNVEDEQVVTIESLETISVKSDVGEVQKPALKFEELEKPMVLNPTNARRLAELVGSVQPDDAVGKRVKLYVDHDVVFGGKRTRGLRLSEASEEPF